LTKIKWDQNVKVVALADNKKELKELKI